ncbi:MAG: hypothetical protein KA978_23140 [Deltaproteobacteria bacterium]|nr:hypothetical protein [Deltaproteobacteria bacterium]
MARSTKFLFPFAALGLISGLAGCGDDPVSGTPGTDAGTPATDVPTTPADAGEARTYDYVINHLLLDEGAEPGVTTRAFYGFNLDGRISPTRPANQQPADCSRGDYFSTIDPDQNMGTCMAGTAGGGAACQGGVDNQLPNVAQTIMSLQASLNVQNTLNEQVDTGKFLILVRVTGVNGTLGPSLNDPSVHVLVYPFAYATFANCANIQMANQMYQVDNRSLTTAGDLSSARLQFDGSIVNGRLRVNPPAANPSAPNFSIPLSLQGMTLNLNLFQTQLRVTLGATDGTAGNLGGYLRQGDLIDALTSIPALMQYREAAAPLIQGFVDIATAAALGDAGAPATVTCDAPQGGIGVGLGFTTKVATIATTTVATAPSGVCGGASTGSDAGVPRD